MTQTKQHKWFNLRLYADMLRQLKLTGLIMAAACVIITLLPIVILALDDYASITVVTMDIMAPVLWGYLYIGGVGLVYAAFSYLNQRNGCDFYYSLPNKARATYLSILSAVATWIVGTVVLTVLVGWCGYAAIGCPSGLAYPLRLIAYFGSGTLAVASCATIAVCISGTRFANLIITALILFLPRLITLLIGDVVCHLAGNVPYSALPMLMNPSYNIAAFPFAALTNGFDFDSMLKLAPAYLYTFVLALLLAALGLWLFCRRRSETAGKSAPSRLLQHIYRSALAVPLLVIMAYIGIIEYGSLGILLSDEFSLVLVFVVVTAMVYFAYELITTKRFKNVLTTAPLFAVLMIVVPLAFSLAANGVGEAALNRRADADDVRYVQLVHNRGGRADYTQLITDEIRFEETELIELLCDLHDRTVSDIKEGYFAFSGMNRWEVTFSTGLRSFTRAIALTNREVAELQELMLTNEEFVTAYRQLPHPSDVKSATLDGTRIDGLWEVYYDEVGAYTGDAFDLAIGGFPYNGNLELVVVGEYNLQPFRSYYYLNDYTPKTLASAIRAINAESRNETEQFCRVLQDISANLVAYGWAQIDFFGFENVAGSVNFEYNRYGGEKPTWIAFIDGQAPVADQGELQAVIEKAVAEAPAAHEAIDHAVPLLQIRFSIEYENNGEWQYLDGRLLLPITEEEAEALWETFAARKDIPNTRG